MTALGAARSRKRVRNARHNQRESQTLYGGRLMRELPAILAKALDEWKLEAAGRPGMRHRALAYLEPLDSLLVSTLALRVIVDSLSLSRAYTRTATSIATMIEDEVMLRKFKCGDPLEFTRSRIRYSGYEERRRIRLMLRQMVINSAGVQRWPDDVKASVGIVLLELAVTHCGIVRAYTVRRGRRDELRLEATPECLKWCEDQAQHGELFQPLYLPFLECPLDWIDPWSGGFHSTNVWASAVVKTTDRQHLEQVEKAHMHEVYSALNVLQRTGYRMNRSTWKMFAHFWENSLQVAGMPCRDVAPLPPKPEDIGTNAEARKAWKRAAALVHEANRQRRGDRMYHAKVFWIGQKYLEESSFWYCHQLDWRGRAYPVGYFLHPQGSELVRSLLEFAQGKPVNTPDAIKWHRIHGANSWGLDKVPFERREAWVLEKHAAILEMAADPLRFSWWQDASKPWQFLAWAVDYLGIHTNPGHLSHLPIHQDATQSGIQIYSLLLRDEEGAHATNCLPSDYPQDLYGSVATELRGRLMRLAAEGHQIAQDWLDFGIDRSCAKRPTMTRVYNSTRHSARQYVEEWATEKGKAGQKIPTMTGGSSGVWWLTEQLWAAMDVVISSTARGQQWLTQCASIFVEHNQPIRWVSPLGLPVSQWYAKTKTRTVKTLASGIYRQVALRESLDLADRRRMMAALAPNVIHSMDAAAMSRTMNIVHSRGVHSVAAIHDSFATLAADAQVLADATREAYVQLFSRDLLGDLRDQLQAQLPAGIELPPVPEAGTLDVNLLRQSLYFFS